MSFATLSSPATIVLSKNLVREFHIRKLLYVDNSTFDHYSKTASPPMSVFVNGAGADQVHGKENKGFDVNAVMVLAVLVCALVISLGLNSIIKCVRRCSRLLSSSSRVSQNSTISLAATATGITKKDQKAYLTIAYLAGPHVDAQCVICLAEFTTSEIVLILPKCHHGFHVSCIDKWLRSHSSCPTCRNSLIEAPEKIITVGQQAAVASLETLVLQPLSTEEAVVVIIAPLEPEGVVLNYRRVSSSQLLSESLA